MSTLVSYDKSTNTSKTYQADPDNPLGLPANLHRKLAKAAHKLDTVTTDIIIEEIDKDFPEIATGLVVLAQEFRFDRILELLRTVPHYQG